MAVQKTGGNTNMDHVLRGMKDTGGKTKTAVPEDTATSGYANVDNPVKPHDAAASNAHAAGKFVDKHKALLVRAAGKFAGKLKDFLTMKKGDATEIPRGRVMTNPYFTETKGETVEIPRGRVMEEIRFIREPKPIISDDTIRALLQKALEDPNFPRNQSGDVYRFLDSYRLPDKE